MSKKSSYKVAMVGATGAVGSAGSAVKAPAVGAKAHGSGAVDVKK